MWVMIKQTSRSGKQLWICDICLYVTSRPVKSEYHFQVCEASYEPWGECVYEPYFTRKCGGCCKHTCKHCQPITTIEPIEVSGEMWWL